MLSINLMFIVIFISIINSIYCLTKPVIKLENDEFNATIVGVVQHDMHNQAFNAFVGIPYAKPPMGELRFKDPQKLKKFEGTFYATYDGYECHSITAINASEDCLNLNVYSKKLTPNQLLPVVVVLHPGGLYLGSSKLLKPSYMMTKEIVLVTFNYRLGTMGFLNLGTAEVPGNAGFKDQVYALRWVKKNIVAFGGNPQDITLMGYSAGGLSVSLHLVSPMSKGLFHKAIIMSGSVPPQAKIPQREQKFVAIRQAKRVNCSYAQNIEEAQWFKGNMVTDYTNVSNSDILQCLQNIKAKDISSTLRSMFDFGKDNPIYLWLPVEEQDFNQEKFLTEDFYTILQKMDGLEIPLLIGYANGEFCTSAGDILKDTKLKLKFQTNFDELAPRIFMYESRENSGDITDKIREFYFNDSKEFQEKDYDRLCDLFSDSLIRFGAQRLAEIVQQKGLVYFYEFRYQGSKVEDVIFPFKKDRVEHMDDLQYLFNWSDRDNLSKEELHIVELYSEFIYDFVRNGKISNSNAKPYPESFAVIDKGGIHYEPGTSFQNYDFWMDLINK